MIMTKSMMTMAAGITAALTTGAVASYKLANRGPQFAQVVNVTAVSENVSMPVEECEDISVRVTRPVRDRNAIAGTVAGGALGGALGSTLGNSLGGRGTRELLTVGGVVAGGVAGHQIQRDMQASDTYRRTRRECKVVNKLVPKVIGYDVKYLLDGELGTLRMDRDPGAVVPIQDGKLAVARL